MSKTPIVRPVSKVNLAVTLSLLVIIVLVGYAFNRSYGVMFGAIIYLGLSQFLARTVPRHHRRAIRHCKNKEFESAISEFHKSIEFFERFSWVDQFRSVTMLSGSGMCYREMALVSLGFCYAQIGEVMSARQHYEQCMQEFPNNEMAKSAVRLMDAG